MVAETPSSLPHIEVLRARLAPARFDKYVAAAKGDPILALRLYEWNIRASASLHGAIGQFEVLLRNALDVQLSKYHRTVIGGDGSWWTDAAMPFQADLAEKVTDARRRARRGGAPETHGKVIAELMFGFWRFLLDSQHSGTLWAPRCGMPSRTCGRRYGPRSMTGWSASTPCATGSHTMSRSITCRSMIAGTTC
jgi:hypothetical protein